MTEHLQAAAKLAVVLLNGVIVGLIATVVITGVSTLLIGFKPSSIRRLEAKANADSDTGV